MSLLHYGNGRELEYDFVLAAGVDAGIIRLSLEGAENLRTDARGDLILARQQGEIRHKKPLFYQVRGSARETLRGRYVITGKRQVGFAITSHNPAVPLVIDPVLEYFSYLGGQNADVGTSIAVNAFRNSYIGDTPRLWIFWYSGIGYQAADAFFTHGLFFSPKILDSHRVRLRSERSGRGTGRVYTVHLTCTDSHGAFWQRLLRVSVPKSDGS